ncbi:hypothetical protein CAPTEDRAFT_228741 [Capitella teleta]|uniref:Tyrosine-protein phosphatase non-receptor type 9 n=1 Tax=Capitella teleta TaxID=283909 RepID=R7UTD5_CAPTE|nr:hypothetical protein CAPTEDRAFT_228741 [Capitella teleta]|eukprot:ELU07177.1 hypothetical protein CAPTEDRAFT_228741 [Capitella teleta]
MSEIIEDLNQNEAQCTKDFIERVTELRNEPTEEPVPWSTAVKFLMARKFDVKRAIDLYLSHQKTRQKEGISQIDARDEGVRNELLTEKFTILPSRDCNGAAIALFTVRLHFPEKTTHQAVLRALVFQLDVALKSADTQRNGLVFVYDMTHSKYTNFDYDLSIKILSMLKGSYPARLKKVLIVTAPLWFKAPFKIIRLFVREKLRDRVYTINILQLPVHIPLSSLPLRFGGKMEVSHRDWIHQCLRSAWGKNSEGEISTYLEGMNSADSVGSLSSMTVSSAAESEDSDNKRSEQNMDTSDCSSSPTSPHHEGSLLGKRGADFDSEGGLNKKSLKEEPSLHGPESGGFTIRELVDYCRIKGRRGLRRQYEVIKMEPPQGTFDVSKCQNNLPKNRYTDVLCLDHSRVQLANDSDYINANFVDGYRQKNAYISSQGPLPRTFLDFWRMVWEQMVLVVVMTTRTVERQRIKCGQYWPQGGEEESMQQFGKEFVVINTGVERKNEYIVSTLLLQNLKTEESRQISHFQYVGWPDYDVPSPASSFLDFMLHVRQEQQARVLSSHWTGHPNGPPMVVHCSAGIGRTGTFITMDISTRRLADIGTVDIVKTVRRIRSQRAFSIQMPEQFVFCHLGLIEHAQREGLVSDVNLEGFDDSSSEDD